MLPVLTKDRITKMEGLQELPVEQQEKVYFPLQAEAQGFSLEREISAGGFLAGDRLVLRQPGRADTDICSATEVRLRGRHNLANILAAACLTAAGGATVDAIASVAKKMKGAR